MSTTARDSQAAPPAPAVLPAHPPYEFALTTVPLFALVTAVRWIMAPGSAFLIADVQAALAVVGEVVGVVLLLLIRSRGDGVRARTQTRRSPVALWLTGAFPARSVLPYVIAQLGGSLAGAGPARLVWGHVAAAAPAGYAALQPPPAGNTFTVFLAEAGCLLAVTLLIGFFPAHPERARHLPLALAVTTALIVAVFGPRSGGATNPARQFGPALVSGTYGHLGVCLLAPTIGAALGAGIHLLLRRHAGVRRVPTYRLCPTADPDRSEKGPTHV